MEFMMDVPPPRVERSVGHMSLWDRVAGAQSKTETGEDLRPRLTAWLF